MIEVDPPVKSAWQAQNDWAVSEKGGLTLLFSPMLSEYKRLVHAFTTRRGGSSESPLDSFNLGRHWPSDSSRQDAMANRSRLCAVLGLNFHRLTVPGQVHSTDIAWVSDPEPLPDKDGVATVACDTPLLLHYADCVPIIVYDTKMDAVAVLHAGWRGTAGGIASKAVRLFEAVVGSQPKDLVAAIGPAIGSCCYPVGEEVAVKLSQSIKDKGSLVVDKGGIPHPDLKGINARQLMEAGIKAVDVCMLCTACTPEYFYSHRQSGGRTGRQGALACLRPGD